LINFISPAYAQTIIPVNTTTACFLNYSAGLEMWENCGADEDFLTFAMLPFEWITGGYFSMIIVSVFILMIYLKYHQMVYCIVIGIIFLPVSFQFFPQVFLGWAMILVVLAIAGYILYMLKRQTD
jgi:hypothetical protein